MVFYKIYLFVNKEAWGGGEDLTLIIDCEMNPSVWLTPAHFPTFIFYRHVPMKFSTLLRLNSLLYFTVVN